MAPQVIDPQGWLWLECQSGQDFGRDWGAVRKGLAQRHAGSTRLLAQSSAHNDFIFSVLAEETGFIGSLLVILAFTALILNGIRIAGLARDHFGRQLCLGVSILFLIHFFINIRMTIGLHPSLVFHFRF